VKGDFSRNTFKKEKYYSGVRMQQGRVQLDADWNEQVDIAANRIETEARDVIGRCGAPINQDGFHLVADYSHLTAEEQARLENQNPSALQPRGDFYISAGRCYVDGILCENERIATAKQQPDLPQNAAIVKRTDNTLVPLPPPEGFYLAYLDVWKRHLTAVEDPQIREVALGGPDTATRLKTIWQVRLLELAADFTPGDDSCAEAEEQQAWKNLIALRSARLTARTTPGAVSDNPCIIAPDAGYRGRENQLYRVEIHHADATGTATFKWSRDNGSIASAITEISGNTITVLHPGRDARQAFAPGQWVEIIDEARELMGRPGTLARLTAPTFDTTLTFDPATVVGEAITPANFPLAQNPKVRRWDHKTGAAAITTAATWIALEDGVEVKFETGDQFETGDYWLIPARTISGDIEWPRDDANTPLPQQRLGIFHHYCPLTVMQMDAAGNWTVLDDCRELFPPLTEICESCKCHDFLDDLRADGIVRNPDTGEMGFVVSAPGGLTINYSGGIAYVAGCRHEVPAGSIEEVDLSTTYQTLLVNAKGQVELIIKDDLPEKYAAIAIISTYEGEIKRIIDARFDLTHLDEKVQANTENIAARRPDRRQFVPLLAYSIKGLQYRDGRNRTFNLTGHPQFVDGLPYGLASDGENIWSANFVTDTVAKIPRAATDLSEVQFFPLNITNGASWAVAFDGCCLWFTLYNLNLVVRLNPANSETLRIQVGLSPMGIAFDGDFVWVCNNGSQSLSVIDVETCQVVRTIAVTGDPISTAFDGTHIWVAANPNSLFKIEKPWGEPELVTNRLVNDSRYMVFDGTHLWISSRNGPLQKLEISSSAPEEIAAIPQTHAIAFDGTHLWALRRTTQPRVFKLDVDTNQIIGQINLDVNPFAALFDGTHLWISSNQNVLKRLV